MKKTLSIFIIFLSVFLLYSCSGTNLNTIPEQNIRYTNLYTGNVIDDGEIAVFLNFDSDFPVSEMEIEGDLLDRNGRSIHKFDTKMTFQSPSDEPSIVVFVSSDIVTKISTASIGQIKAYTVEPISLDKSSPAAAESSSTVDWIAVFFLLVVPVMFVLVVGVVSIILMKSQKKENDDTEMCQNDNCIISQERVKLSEDNQKLKIDKFEEIKRYKELLDMGIITQEEFEGKKKDLLG